MRQIKFTTKNLLKNLHRLGGWSAFGLAETAIEHYHPEIKRMKDTTKKIQRMANLKCDGKENTYWEDWIKKYHTEVGYKPEGGVFNPDAVNEY